jgi:hypothetical protein
MARGIEELAEMQVTGPVQGGDMVMKPDQAPVGAAALLNKMSRQNTPGIFKLPMPDKQMPGFMKVAAEGVEQQTAQGDTINKMAGELLRQGIDIRGMGMDEIIQIYEQIFGSPGDVDQFGVSKNLFPGNFTDKEQDVVMLPKNLKTAPDAEETELAYITPDEQALLAFMKPGTPHVGPENVPSYDSYDYGVQTTSGDWADYETGGGDAPKAYEQARERAATDKSYAEKHAVGGQTGEQMQQQAAAEIAQEIAQGGGKLEDYEKGQELGLGEIIKTGVEKGWDFTKGLPIMAFKAVDALSGAAQAWEEKQVEDLISKLGTGEAATGWGNLLAAMTTDGKLNKRGKDWFEDWGDKLGEGEHKETKWDDKDPEKQLEELLRLAKGSGGDEFMKHYDPDTYYKDPKNWDAKEMAQAQKEGKLKMNRKNTAMIEEGRRRLEQEAGPAQDRHPGTRRSPIEQVTEIDTIEETTPIDERAGAFNVGGTMPYTDDIRTAGVEMDVPLGRRFDIDKAGKYRGTGMDLNEAMQYATLGGYQQLEPFQEYLTRRRKHLGEDEPIYFDEEGNVIYSGVT